MTARRITPSRDTPFTDAADQDARERFAQSQGEYGPIPGHDEGRDDYVCAVCGQRYSTMRAAPPPPNWSCPSCPKAPHKAYRIAVYGAGETSRSYNGCVFATHQEALGYGRDLQSRWHGMDSFEVEETTGQVTYRFDEAVGLQRIAQ